VFSPTWTFDFGEGTLESANPASHVYNRPGAGLMVKVTMAAGKGQWEENIPVSVRESGTLGFACESYPSGSDGTSAVAPLDPMKWLSRPNVKYPMWRCNANDGALAYIWSFTTADSADAVHWVYGKEVGPDLSKGSIDVRPGSSGCSNPNCSSVSFDWSFDKDPPMEDGTPVAFKATLSPIGGKGPVEHVLWWRSCQGCAGPPL